MLEQLLRLGIDRLGDEAQLLSGERVCALVRRLPDDDRDV